MIAAGTGGLFLVISLVSATAYYMGVRNTQDNAVSQVNQIEEPIEETVIAANDSPTSFQRSPQETLLETIDKKLQFFAEYGIYTSFESDVASFHLLGGADSQSIELLERYVAAEKIFLSALNDQIEEARTSLLAKFPTDQRLKLGKTATSLEEAITSADLRNARENLYLLWKACGENQPCQQAIEQFSALFTLKLARDLAVTQRYSKSLQSLVMTRQLFPQNIWLTEWERRTATLRSTFIIRQALAKKTSGGPLEMEAIEQLALNAPATFRQIKEEIRRFLKEESAGVANASPDVGDHWLSVLAKD